MYAQNTLNVSNFYNPKLNLNPHKIRFYVLGILISIAMLSYIFVSIGYGHELGRSHLHQVFLSTHLFILYMTIRFGTIEIQRGYIGSISLPFLFLFKRKKKITELGSSIVLLPSDKFEIDTELITQKASLMLGGVIEKQLIIDDEPNFYLINLSGELDIESHLTDQIILSPQWKKHRLGDKKEVLVQIYLIPKEELIDKAFLEKTDFTFLGRVFTKKA